MSPCACACEAVAWRPSLSYLVPPSSAATGSTHRNVKQLAALNAEDLNLWELSVLCDFEDEEHRRGHFTRIFPTPETRYYNQFFESHKWDPLPVISLVCAVSRGCLHAHVCACMHVCECLMCVCVRGGVDVC